MTHLSSVLNNKGGVELIHDMVAALDAILDIWVPRVNDRDTLAPNAAEIGDRQAVHPWGSRSGMRVSVLLLRWSRAQIGGGRSIRFVGTAEFDGHVPR